MLRGCFVGCVNVVLLAASSLAAETPDPWEGKVRDLAHPRYAEREKAARVLEAAGEPALKALREAAQSSDEELRARAASVAGRIERVARSERLLAAPKLALKFDKVPLVKAVNQFAGKTNLRYVIDATKIKDTKRPITLDTGELPFWEAVAAFYKAAGLTEDEQPTTTGGQEPTASGTQMLRATQVHIWSPPIRLIDGQFNSAAISDRAFRVRNSSAIAAEDKYDDVKGEVTFHLSVDPVPSLTLREIIGIEVRQAIAVDGRSLAPAYPVPPFDGLTGGYEQQLMRQVMVVSGDLVVDGNSGAPTHAITLKTGGLRPKKLAELRGVVVARVITPPEAIVTVDQLLRPERRQVTADGVTVQVKEVNAGSDNRVVVKVVLTTRTDQMDEFLNLPVQMKGRARQFIRIQRMPGPRPAQQPDLKVCDAAGVPIRGLSAQVVFNSSPIRGNIDGTPLVQEMKLSFEKPATLGNDELSLVLMGKRAAVVEMPFVLKDVPLP